MIAGLAGLEPMPRKRALLTLRAVNSVKTVFGAKIAASVIARRPELAMVVGGHGRDAGRHLLHVRRFFLRGHDDRWQDDARRLIRLRE